MNNSFNRFFIILFLMWLVHVPGTLPGKATNGDPVKFALRDTVADRPVVRQPQEKGREKDRDTTKGRQTSQGQQGRNPGKGGGETSMEEFVPSEEIKAGQAVDFPADI